MTGADLAEPFRGRYKSASEARAIVRSLGCKSHVDYVARYLPRIKPIMASTGDVAVVDGGALGKALGIVMSSRIAVYAPDGSPAALPLTAALAAFKVG